MPEGAPHRRAGPQKSLVGFVVGEVSYALDIRRVREIVNPLDTTPLPHTPAEVRGVADHRGTVIPVIDLRVRFGLPPAGESRSIKWILVDAGDMTVAVVVDRVTEVFGTEGEGLRPPPPVGGNRDMRGILGVTTHDGALTFVLDVSRFVEIAEALAASGAI